MMLFSLQPSVPVLKTFVLKAMYRCDITSSLFKRYPSIQPFIPFKMDAHSGRLKADMYSHNFNNLLGKSYDNYTNKFPQTTPPFPPPLCSACPYSLHPFLCYCHWHLCLYLKVKSNPRLQQTQWPCSIAWPLAEERKGEKHEGTIMGSVQVLSEAQLEF